MRSHGNADLVEPLTDREQEVLELLAQRKTNRELAERLVLSVHTVKWHNQHIYAKLGVENREQAAERARQLGLVKTAREQPRPENNLPAALGTFVGREAELATLDQLLADSDVRLVTISGVGGAGKTRLAYAAAERQLERRLHPFADGIYAVSLSSLDAPEQLPGAIADAVDHPLQDSRQHGRTAWDQLTEYLQEKRVLLLLDNFEHLLESALSVGELVQRTATLQLLITSRERLMLREEHVFPLDGFTDSDSPDMSNAGSDPFVQLFLHSARRVRPDFELTPEGLEPLAHLREITGGLPLPVELAASWVEVLPLREIVAEIRRDADFLQSDLRNLPRRQRSMRAVFEASWRRLDPALQTVFARLSVFRGGFTRSAAHEVAAASVTNLAALSAKSLVQYEAEPDRYMIHELLRQYGEGKLQAKPDLEQDAGRCHAAFYCRYLQQREQQWVGERAAEVLAEVESEMGNIRRAWNWAVARAKVSLMADGLHSLCAYHDRRGFQDEVRQLLGAAIESVRSLSAQTDDDIVRLRLLVRLLSWRGRFATSVVEACATLDQAETVLEELRKEKVDVRREEAFFSLHRGHAEIKVDPMTARSYFKRSLSLYRELGAAAGKALARTALGSAEWELGNYGEAAELLQRGLDGHKALGNWSGVATGLNLLGLIEKHRGRVDEARQAHHDSYDLYHELGEFSGAVVLAGNLATTLCWSGEFEEARAVALEGLRLADEVGLQRRAAYLTDSVANACIHLGRYDEAQKYAERAAGLARATGDRQALGWALTDLGKLSVVAASYEKAVARFNEAVTALTEFGKSIWTLPFVFQIYALQQLGRLSKARECLAEALHANMKPRVFLVVVSALPAAARLVARQGDACQALEFYALAHRYRYVAHSRWFADVVGEDVAEWARSLPDDVVDAVRERGRSRDLWETAEELLDGLD